MNSHTGETLEFFRAVRFSDPVSGFSCLRGWISDVDFFCCCCFTFPQGLTALYALPRFETAEGSKRQRRWFHKVGHVPLLDICSLNAVLALAQAGWAAQCQAKWQPGLASQASPSMSERKSCWFRTLCLVNKSAIWHFIMLMLKSYKNLKLAMVSIHQAAKCATCLTLNKWFLTQPGELLSCNPSLLYYTNLWKEMYVWKMYCAEGQRERVTATMWLLTRWLFISLGLFGQRNYFCTKQTFAKFGIIFMLQRLLTPAGQFGRLTSI